MESTHRPRAAFEARSGGKILRGRRTAALRTTPYDRPPPPPSSPPPAETPNWFKGFLFPATRVIANGAGKFLSFVFNSDTSSSSSEDGDADSERDVDDDVGCANPSDKLDELNERAGSLECSEETQQIVEWTGTKRVIEQLLTRETFSREECKRLVSMINSRVVDCSNIKDGQDGRLTGSLPHTPGNGTPDICSKAVSEARKWLEEKRMLSSPELELNYGTSAFNSVRLPKASVDEVGSPIDMAKLYMKGRPPWASPYAKHVELKTPSSTMTDPFKEETRHFTGSHSLPSSKKRDGFAMGSWNINEEIRRVRSKATEELLQSIPSTKIDLSSYSAEPKTDLKFSVANKAGDYTPTKAPKLDSTVVTKAVEEPLLLSAGVRTIPDMQQDGFQTKTLASNPTFVSEENQQKELETNQVGDVATSNSYQATYPEGASKQYAGPKSSENCSGEKEVAEPGSMANGNGVTSRQSSKHDQENHNRVDTSHSEKGINKKNPAEVLCELLSEASVEVPYENAIINETDSIASGSQNSSSMQYESKDLAPSNLEEPVLIEEEAINTRAKPVAKKTGRYTRRGRGRSKS